MSEFYDPVLKKCRYRMVFLANEIYGGWSAECEKGFISTDYVPPETVLSIAKAAGLKVHLAGDIWTLVGRKGWGETVDVDEAQKLVEALRKIRMRP
jgi:hypothetical protein